jgi:hypothetical protein
MSIVSVPRPASREPVIEGWLVFAAVGVLAFSIAVGFVLSPRLPGHTAAVDSGVTGAGSASPGTVEEPAAPGPSPSSDTAPPQEPVQQQPPQEEPVPQQPGPRRPTTSSTGAPAPTTPAATSTPPTFTTYEAEAALNTLAGTAAVTAYANSSGDGVVTGIGLWETEPGVLTFTNVTVFATGGYLVTIHYLHSGPDGERAVDITVVGSDPVRVDTSGGPACCETGQVRLPLTRGVNTVTISNLAGPAPDIDRIDVPALAS